jgi:hypothetical protein
MKMYMVIGAIGLVMCYKIPAQGADLPPNAGQAAAPSLDLQE